MTEGQLKSLAHSIEGVTCEDDCFVLYDIARKTQAEGDILEIGNFKGRVTVCIAKALEENGQGKIYTIDANILNVKDCLLRSIGKFGVSNIVMPIFKHSSVANSKWKRPLKMIWIDTDCNYFSVVCDFILWERHLACGGVIALAGANLPSIKKVVNDYIINSSRFFNVTTKGSIVFASKVRDTPVYPISRLTYIKFIYYCHYLIKKAYFGFTHLLSFLPADKNYSIKKKIGKIFDRLLLLK